MSKINGFAAIALLIILTLLFPQEWQAAEASARCDRFSPTRELAKAKDKVATFNTNRGTR
jgi:hypothetical protein